MNDRLTTARMTHWVCALLGLGGAALASCSGEAQQPTPTVSQEESAGDVLRLATTTSTRDSGLLDELLPVFEEANRCRVDVVAVGTGAALKLGEAGDADVVMVHARKAEEAFMQAGHGVRHEEFMYNDFVLLGPEQDPAGIRNVEPVEAMKKIAEGQHGFVSRGDDSGTHKRELSLWDKAGGRSDWDAYLEAGQGMGPTLIMADEKQVYVLADMGTFLNLRDKISLVPLAAPAESLQNPYAAVVVNPEKHEKINRKLADAFVDFLISGQAQRLIAGYQIAGQQLFYPTRLDSDG
jgi:tungstate transport system substrate-binding protein